MAGTRTPEQRRRIVKGAAKSHLSIRPQEARARIEVPDATPPLIRTYALDEKEKLLAIVRYNRLADTFLGLTAFSLQTHLRTTAKGIGQIAIDELYIGFDNRGGRHVVLVQVTGSGDRIGALQAAQAIQWAEEKFPGMRCHTVAAQFAKDGAIALFELTLQKEELKIADERHYQLIPA